MATLIVQLILNGMALGFVYMILAAGLVLIMSTSGIFYMAYGQFYMLGAYITWACIYLLNLPFFVSLIIAVCATTILSLLSYRFIFKYVQVAKRQFLSVVVAAVGLMWIIGQAGLLIFGTTSKSLPPIFPGIIDVAGITLPYDKMVLMTIALVITIILFLIYEKTRIGMVMRAVAFSPEAASIYGIETSNIYLMVMGIGGALAGIGGAIIAPSYSVHPEMGNNIILSLMLIVMLGGMDSLIGTIPAGFILGMTLSFGQYFIGGQAQLLLYAVVGIIIFLRPNGLLGRGAELKV
jgi:branched-chain amino acid transport system permease protein